LKIKWRHTPGRSEGEAAPIEFREFFEKEVPPFLPSDLPTRPRQTEFVGYLARIPLTDKDFYLHRPQLK
jgi:hypothetical protein